MTYLDDLAALIRSCLPADAEPPEDSDDLFRIYAVLLGAKGDRVTAEDVHNAWVAWKQTSTSDHRALIPFSDLTLATQDYDMPYVRAIHQAAQKSGTNEPSTTLD
ncbi:hypothetical protein ACIQEY_34595 [Streptomyces parvus]|uniref:DUF7701 domain-containing protein n=1 Tax=Streptomyces parvus TaxID=66428 RepID=UPI00380F1758